MRLQGRVALVTGASRGVGQATALECARRGADLVLAARTVTDPLPNMPGTLTETADAVRALGRDALVVPADLNDMAAVEDLAAAAVRWRAVMPAPHVLSPASRRRGLLGPSRG